MSRPESAERAERWAPEMWRSVFRGRDRGKNPTSAGGAPGGAGPYVIGLAPRARPRKPCPSGEAVPKGPPRDASQASQRGLANPWRLPALHFPRGTEKRDRAAPAPLKKSKPRGAERWLFLKS